MSVFQQIIEQLEKGQSLQDDQKAFESIRNQAVDEALQGLGAIMAIEETDRMTAELEMPILGKVKMTVEREAPGEE